eukprot:5558069-Alexandrium_andersonii.AAC.1
MPGKLDPKYAHLLALLPAECHPQAAPKGQHSYSLTNPNGACVQVLLRPKAFFLPKRAGGEAYGHGAGQHWSWS